MLVTLEYVSTPDRVARGEDMVTVPVMSVGGATSTGSTTDDALARVATTAHL